MTTARQIITDTLTYGLNRLSPGEPIDADLMASCLQALNNVCDGLNGGRSFLFREVLTVSSPITGTSALLSVAWAGIAPGTAIEGATVQYSAGQDVPLWPLTMAQYANIAIKDTAVLPMYYAPDGLDTVYFWPACAGQTVTLRTKATFAEFVDLETDYSMPQGYRSGLAGLLGEKLAYPLLGRVPDPVARAAQMARQQLGGQSCNPAIIQLGPVQGNILDGRF